jgi:AcrR family transcriptional regulator
MGEYKSLSKSIHRTKRVVLSKEDWVNAALVVLVSEGVSAVEITRLASDLTMTRGSFYWHFKDRGDLLACLIDEWQHLNSDVMGKALEGSSSLEEGILALFSVWVAAEPFNAQLDQAMRDWARHSEAVKEAVEEEDDKRLATIKAFFERQGFEATEAFIRARVLYFTQVAYYALGVEEPMAQRLSYLKEYYRSFTGREINPETAEAYCQSISQKEKVA